MSPEALRQGQTTQGAGPLVFARPAFNRARPGAGSAIFRLGPEENLAPPGNSGRKENVDKTIRKPLFLFEMLGLFLLR